MKFKLTRNIHSGNPIGVEKDGQGWIMFDPYTGPYEQHGTELVARLNNGESMGAEIVRLRKMDGVRENEFWTLLEQHDYYMVNPAMILSVARRPAKPWYVYKNGTEINVALNGGEPVAYEKLSDALTKACEVIQEWMTR